MTGEGKTEDLEERPDPAATDRAITDEFVGDFLEHMARGTDPDPAELARGWRHMTSWPTVSMQDFMLTMHFDSVVTVHKFRHKMHRAADAGAPYWTEVRDLLADDPFWGRTTDECICGRCE